MKNNLQLTLILLFCGISILLQGQSSREEKWIKGFYQDNFGVIRNGYFKPSGDRINFIKFKDQLNSRKVEDISPTEVKMFSDNEGNEYHSTQIFTFDEIETIFAKKIVRGNYNLFRGFDRNLDNVFFANKINSDTLIRIKSKNVKQFFGAFFKQCPENTKWKSKYNYRNLLWNIKKGNSCEGEEDLIVYEKAEKFTYSYGTSIDAEIGRNDLVESAGVWSTLFSEINSTTSFGVGGNFLINVNNMLEFNLGLQYTTFTFETKEDAYIQFTRSIPAPTSILSARQGYDFDAKANINFKILEIPLHFKFLFFKKKKLNVFLAAGGVLRTASKFDIQQEFPTIGELRYSIGTVPVLEEPQARFIESDIEFSNPSFFVGIGLRQRIKENNFIQIGLNRVQNNFDFTPHYELYSTPESFIETKSFTMKSKTVRYSLSIGYVYFFKNKVL